MEGVALTEGLAALVKEELCWTGQQRNELEAGAARGSKARLLLNLGEVL